ncbi:hypothetical protein EYZ11_012529 [Aspergillus tanneri]|nr:hypothetical protein EYZ11_012529 [Aspergillus tanneri]
MRSAVASTHFVKFHPFQQKRNQLDADAKIALRNDIWETLNSGPSDSSAGEGVDNLTSAPTVAAVHEDDTGGKVEPYDVAGQMILPVAVNKAVERFEMQEAEKLVKEYEMVPYEQKAAPGYLADDDFELVDHGWL